MNKWKKAISVGMSAALVASLFSTIAAGTVLAAATDYGFTVTGAGNIPTTGTSGAVSIAVTEGQATGWDAAGNTLTFTMTDSSGAGDPTIDWAGTPAISGAPGSLTGITVSKSLNVLTVSFTASNTAQIENFTISGMKITTDGAATGAVRVIAAKTAGGGTGTIPTGTGTASAEINGDLAAGSTAVPYILDAGSFPFAVTDANNGNLQIAAPDAESRGISAIGNPLTLATATGAFHADGTAITQSVAVVGLLSGVATVVPTVTIDTDCSVTTVLPGEQNQWLDGGSCELLVGESDAGTIAKNSVVTFTIDTPGVTFSQTPNVDASEGGDPELNGNGVGNSSNPCTLSFDRTSCSVTVTKASTSADSETLELESMKVDVAASVPLGSKVGINVTTSPAVPVVVTDNQVAVVARVVVGVAATPIININYNDQPTGMITLNESGAGFFTDGPSNNYFGLCLTSGESFTRAPWAVVTVGDLKLRSGVVGATSVQGTLFSVGANNCVYWIVYTASTVASTIEIRGSDASNAVLPSGANNGPRLSVPGNLTPGPDAIDVLIGNQADVTSDSVNAFVTTVSNAIRAYKSDVIVAAVSQPVVPAGSVAALGGNVTISETLNGQFKPGEWICVSVEPRSSNFYVQDTYFNTASNNMLPIISTNPVSGLIVGPVFPNAGCNNYADHRSSFEFQIVQQAFAPSLGVITISNINFTVNADAPAGPIILHVFHEVETAGVDFGAFVSNAKVGSNLAGTAATRLGVTQVGAFTTSTKVQKVGKYVTYRFDFGVGAAGLHIDIWGATKTGNDWSAFSKVTTRVANASGVVYYYVRQSSATWKSYRANNATGGTWTPARQARWIP
ncbi:MAG: hypothetical protein ACM3JP_01495 [Betaproteobacteria bacterium]